MTEQTTTALIHIQPDADPRVTALYDEGVNLLAYADARVIASDEDIKVATDDLATISGLKKAIEEKRKEYTRPLNDYLKAINAVFRDFTLPLDLADTVNREKVQQYRADQDRHRQEQERINALRREAALAEMELNRELSEPMGLVEVDAAPPKRYLTDAGTLGTAKKWHFEVVNFGELPDEYKVPDMVKIRAVVIAGATIPGVRAWQEETLRVTSRLP